MTFPLEKRLLKSSDLDGAGLLDLFLDYLKEEKIELYPAQEEAILALFAGDNVILNTPTGSGKSLVATALHFYSLSRGRRSVYTCPIKALVNEKFFAFCRIFGPKNVGMTTGDASVNPEAPILCCTAEILSNLALRQGSSALVEDIVMDEFHYYSDRDRGVAWQVPLLSLDYSRFLLMSATLGDPSPFQKILENRTAKNTVIVQSFERPVPLDFKYSEHTLTETIGELVSKRQYPVYLVNFTQRSAAENAQNMLSVDYCSKDEKKAIAAELKGVHFTSPYGKELSKILRHGIGLHHAGLLPKYRLLVEKLTQKGLLKIISGTDTLGMGINVPIRSVVFSQLCKFDGQKTSILSIRDFQQIAGRAGRKGFDDRGTVIAQAPEHIIENKVAESKVAGDPKKLKKLRKKQAPKKGYVPWDEKTFAKLYESQPESLRSSFQVSHGMILNVLSRGAQGCQAMKQILRDCHETDVLKARHRKQAFQMVRSLLDRQIIDFIPDLANDTRKIIRVNLELQDGFSIFHSLAIWLIDTLALLDTTKPEYVLDVLSLVEAILENPNAILLRQVDKAKTIKIWELKQEGVDYDERMAILEKITYPKPKEEFIYQTFNEFLIGHPWLKEENIRPKSIARELYENYMSFDEYVKEYGLQRSEGILLRYLSQVYKALSQTVPSPFHTAELLDVIEFFRAIVKTVDASLIDEWESIGKDKTETTVVLIKESGPPDITADLVALQILVRNWIFKILRLVGNRRYQAVVDEMGPQPADDGQRWTASMLDQILAPYFLEHEVLLTNGVARDRSLFRVERSRDLWTCEQTLADQDQIYNWTLKIDLNLAATRDSQELAFQNLRFIQS